MNKPPFKQAILNRDLGQATFKPCAFFSVADMTVNKNGHGQILCIVSRHYKFASWIQQ